jgi:DNA excision repair protein ERCC-4
VPYRQAKAKRKKTAQLRILQSLPGVGPDRAKRLLERFGTVRACFGASTEEIMDVQGIGSKTAASISQAMLYALVAATAASVMPKLVYA